MDDTSSPNESGPSEESVGSEKDEPVISARKRFVFRAICVLLTLLLAAELIAQFRWKVQGKDEFAHLQFGNKTFREDEATGYMPNANQKKRFEGGMFSTNGLGFRNAEFKIPKPEGVFRIVCLGGSSTWGTGVNPNRDTYPHILGRLLKERFPDAGIQVINAGIAGFGWQNSLSNFERYFRDADLVIAKHAFNDLVNRARWEESPTSISDWFVFRWFRWSAAVRLVGYRIRAHEMKHAKRLDALPESVMTEFMKRLRAFVDAVTTECELVLVTYPCLIRPELPLSEAVGTVPNLQAMLEYMAVPFSYEGLASGISRANEKLRETASERDIHLLDVAPLLSDDPELYVDAIHFKAKGNAALAEAMLPELVPIVREALEKRAGK